MTINLNAGDYDGGDLRFPEYGPRTYRAPTGGAIVFSCSLLHEATPVTRGTRYAFLPFLYDDAAARLREAWTRPRHGRWTRTVYYAPPEVAGYLTGQLQRIRPRHPIQVHPLPDAVTFAQGAALGVPYGTDGTTLSGIAQGLRNTG